MTLVRPPFYSACPLADRTCVFCIDAGTLLADSATPKSEGLQWSSADEGGLPVGLPESTLQAREFQDAAAKDKPAADKGKEGIESQDAPVSRDGAAGTLSELSRESAGGQNEVLPGADLDSKSSLDHQSAKSFPGGGMFQGKLGAGSMEDAARMLRRAAKLDPSSALMYVMKFLYLLPLTLLIYPGKASRL